MKKSKTSGLVKAELILKTEAQCSVKQKTAIRTSLKSLWKMLLVWQSPGIFWMLADILRDLFTALFNKMSFIKLSRGWQVIIIVLHYLYSFITYKTNQEAFNALFKNKHSPRTLLNAARRNSTEIQQKHLKLSALSRICCWTGLY